MADMPHYDGKDRKAVLMRQIKAAIDEENRKDTIERLYKGRQERVRKGYPSGGNVPYGYRRLKKKWVPARKEAQVVKLIFEMAADQRDERAIAETLNTWGHKRRNQMPWTARQVKKILERSRLYREGIFTYGDTVGRNKSLILLEEKVGLAL